MYRFVAFMSASGKAFEAEHIKPVIRSLLDPQSIWHLASRTPGLLVLDAGTVSNRAHAYSLAAHGAVLGKVFPRALARDEVPSDSELGSKAVSLVATTTGRHLIDNYWGRYVAFWRDESRATTHVLRDPSGGLPCFYLRWNGIVVAFNDLQVISDLQLTRLPINWKYVSAFLLHNHVQISDTGIEGISELHPGERLDITTSGTASTFLWNPQTFAQDAVEDFDEAARLVENTAKICIGAWASQYRKILHQLSGGLDSAVVLGGMQQAPIQPEIVCVNEFAPHVPESNERNYARTAAKHLGSDLLEVEMPSPRWDGGRWQHVPPTVKPSVRILSFQHSHLVKLAEQHKPEAFTNGHGGDQIFFQWRRPLGAADFARRHGLRPKLLSAAVDAARLSGASGWTVLKAVLTHGLLQQPFDVYTPFVDTKTLLTREARADLDPEYLVHPWLRDSSSIPPAKLMHILYVADLQCLHETSLTNRIADAPMMLTSQPLVEMCLRIPTYTLTKGGVQRALERRAFANDLPQELLARRSKGGTTRYFNRMIAENVARIRELLLDGSLARNGLLDRALVEHRLSAQFIVRTDGVESLMTAVLAQMWANALEPCRHRAAA